MNAAWKQRHGQDMEDDELEIIKILLEHGSNINIQVPKRKKRRGQTALHIASEFSSPNVFKLLLDHGADPLIQDSKGKTPLIIALEYKKFDTMNTLLVWGVDVNSQDRNGFTAIHYAIVFQYYHCVKIFLEYSADVNIQDECGRTPLHWIVRGQEEKDEDLTIIQLLLDANADVNILFTSVKGIRRIDDIPGDTPLHIAVRFGKIKTIKMLLDFHPNLTICSEYNDTALDIAKNRKSYDIIELIEKEHRHQIYIYLLFRWVSPLFVLPTFPETTK